MHRYLSLALLLCLAVVVGCASPLIGKPLRLSPLLIRAIMT
jgi:hypothetical protein